MRGCLALVLHAHLPFVRHPEHPQFLEENWLFEAITETYLPLLELMEGWTVSKIPWRLNLTLSPTLCAMLRDKVLCDRYDRHLAALINLAEREVVRTHWQPQYNTLAAAYLEDFGRLRRLWRRLNRDLVEAFRSFQNMGFLEILACAATHAVLPLLETHPPSLRAQISTGCDYYSECFGQKPRGFWLPECAYAPAVEPVLKEAGIRWCVLETHGVLHATPRPTQGIYAPIFSPHGLAAFGRDQASAQQVWSRESGYPGDPVYRDFYRDIAFDLDQDYLAPWFPAAPHRSFTGIKYHRITGPGSKEIYNREAAKTRVLEHARHFLEQRRSQLAAVARAGGHQPIVVAPYDAELFGHWWHEGIGFLDGLFRQAAAVGDGFDWVTASDYLENQPRQQLCQPASSTWGEGGFLKVWLNEKNAWVYPLLQAAQTRMTSLARLHPDPADWIKRALEQAAKELMLAQASDWPFILKTGTSPEYARRRLNDHLTRFDWLVRQISARQFDNAGITHLEAVDNLFPTINLENWR